VGGINEKTKGIYENIYGAQAISFAAPNGISADGTGIRKRCTRSVQESGANAKRASAIGNKHG
jgi:hypothetical protein